MAELIPVALKEIVNEKFTCKPGDPIPVKFSAKWVIKFLKEKYGEDAIGYKDSAGLVRESLSQQGSEKLASLEARIDLLEAFHAHLRVCGAERRGDGGGEEDGLDRLHVPHDALLPRTVRSTSPCPFR